MAINLLDVGYYAAANPDLGQNGLTTPEQLTNHFSTSGIDEGRTFSRFVNLQYYASSNPDLAAVGLTSNRQLYDHLSNYGVGDARRFSRFFDTTYYGLANPDLNVLNPGDSRFFNEALFNHVQSNGLNEGRRFSPFFDLSFYNVNNPDLVANGVNSAAALFDHFRNSGLDEQRTFSQFVNIDSYGLFNSDLVNLGLNRRQLFEHLEDYGVGEGRKFSPLVDVDFYLSDPGVQRVIGSDRFQGFRSLQTTGLAEGRRLSPVVDLNVYRAINSDLASANSNLDLFNHLARSGVSEGRRFSLAYDTNFYRSINSDLQGLNNLQLLDHFERFGLTENRVASDSFDVSFYLANNNDLRNAGFNNQQALNHYANLGFREDRRATNIPISLAGDPGDSLVDAGNLGFLSNQRTGTINQSLNNGEVGDVYRFALAFPSNIDISVSRNNQPVNIQLVYDANNNNQAEGDEIFRSNVVNANTARTLNYKLGLGTYYLRVSLTPGQTSDYQLNFSPKVDTSITQTIDPGNTLANAYNLGDFTRRQEVILTDFVGTSDRDDFYRFKLVTVPGNLANGLTLQLGNLNSEVTADLVLDRNNNGQVETGEVVASGRGSNIIELRNTLPEDLLNGTYFLKISTTAFNSNTNYLARLILRFRA